MQILETNGHVHEQSEKVRLTKLPGLLLIFLQDVTKRTVIHVLQHDIELLSFDHGVKRIALEQRHNSGMLHSFKNFQLVLCTFQIKCAFNFNYFHNTCFTFVIALVHSAKFFSQLNLILTSMSQVTHPNIPSPSFSMSLTPCCWCFLP